MTGTPTLIEYADYACPFCYLAHRSLERYHETRGDLAVEWRPYDLRAKKRGPDGRIDETTDIGYPDTVDERIRGLQADHGVTEMLAPSEVPLVDSLDAQVLSLHVRTEKPGEWTAIDAAIFEALWVDGRDVSDPDVLAELATTASAADIEVHDALGDEDLHERLFNQFTVARENGVTDVPTFVRDGRTTTGVLSASELERFVRGE